MSYPILVLDFDGTVCLGDDPVRFYAQEVAARLPEEMRAPMLAQLEAFFAGSLVVEGAEDGYQTVKALAGDAISDEERSAAYRTSRARLDAGEGTTWAPQGLTGLLDELRADGVQVVLVTNAPLMGVGSWLTGRDLLERLDAVIPEAGKPDGMPAILTGILAEHDVEPAMLASVGDVWRNDVEPAIELGAAGLFIDRFGSGRGPSTHTAASIEELYPAIREWARTLLTQSSPN